jgi:glucose dehydrogenase
MQRHAGVTLLAAALAWAAAPGAGRSTAGDGPSRDWPVYRGDPGGTQYVPLAQINAVNVHQLTPVWEYRAGDATDRSTMHVNPIVVDGVMYLTTPSLKAVALDAATGRVRWQFDPAPHNGGTVVRLRNRGVTYWSGAEGRRIFHFVRDRVYALDAGTGALIRSFGARGHIDLRQHLGVDPDTAVIEMTSPGAVYKNFLIVASRVNESYDASPGHIRAYDTVSGELRWIFHTIPREGQAGYDTWTWVKGENYGGANAWGGVTIDETRGWAFAATGSATEDFYGGFRKGDNLFANSVLALDAETGERKWHYQTVRHDIWDYDNPPAPILVTLREGSRTRDAVVQLTKMGFTFVLDRDTGAPLFPVAEVPVPASTVRGEATSPTQPVPLKPPPLVRQQLTEADLTDITPEARAHALSLFRRYRSGPIFTPPSLQGTITTPGHLGGVEWHGASFDPTLNVLYVNANEAPTINRLKAVPDRRPATADKAPAASAGAADRYTIDGYPLFLDPHGVPAIAPPWGTLSAVDLLEGGILWKVPLGEYPQLVAKGIRNTGTLNFGGAVATAGGVVFVAATADEKIRAFEKSSGRVLWEYQLPAGGYATPSVYMVGGRQYVVIAAGGSGKNATRSGDAVIAFALPPDEAAPRPVPPAGPDGWISLFDGKTLDGWVHMNGAHTFAVEDGAIVGRTVERSASMNSFLCSLHEFADFELEVETMVDRITNQGIQIRTQVRPVQGPGTGFEHAPGRINGPQVEVRRSYKGQPHTGVLYGEALGTGWLTSREKLDEGHPYFIDEGWNRLRIVAEGPRIRTWVNGHPVEDLVNEAVHATHRKGFVALQIHGISERELSLPIHAGSGVTTREPLVNRWRNIRVRPIGARD